MDGTLQNSEPGIEGVSESYWMSIGDLMSGLMFIFILALSVFLINITKLTEDLSSKKDTRKEILEEIQNEMKAKGFTEIKIINKQGILRLKQGILFNSGKAKLLPKGKSLLGALAPVTYQVLNKPKYKGKVETVFIEGHTDNEPVSNFNKFDSNWDLSTQRAINTWLYMRVSKDSLRRLLNKNEEQIFSVSGYADSRPITSNKTEEGRRANRRIDFRFNMVPPQSDNEKGPQRDIGKRLNR